MATLAKRALWLTIKLLLVSIFVTGGAFLLGYGFVIYLAPIGMFIASWILLGEVNEMIELSKETTV